MCLNTFLLRRQVNQRVGAGAPNFTLRWDKSSIHLSSFSPKRLIYKPRSGSGGTKSFTLSGQNQYAPTLRNSINVWKNQEVGAGAPNVTLCRNKFVYIPHLLHQNLMQTPYKSSRRPDSSAAGKNCAVSIFS